jgi:hypothetical protein
MPDYQKGKIYIIRSHNTDLVYIGSTCEKYLSNRLGGHRTKYNRFLNGKYKYKPTTFEILKLGDYYIELIEKYPCNSKEELCRREGQIQREINCVNKRIENRTKKEWVENHKEQIKQYKTIRNNCDCGGFWNNGHGFKRHEKTKKHQNYLNNE